MDLPTYVGAFLRNVDDTSAYNNFFFSRTCHILMNDEYGKAQCENVP
jgi:hypothetical protein